jgi:hypothetical protein
MGDVQLGSPMSDADTAAVISFLESLTGEIPKHYAAPEGKR